MPLHPIIDPEIFSLRPDFTALSLSVENGRNTASTSDSEAQLAQAIATLEDTPWADAHLDAWREAYRAFGAKPKRTPSSAEALRKRALKDGQMRSLNAVVDLYNAISMRFAVPVGGEDASSYDGIPHLCMATRSEPFHTTVDGQPVVDAPDPGEVIWRDNTGVTCRRWNWRQGPRTQITEGSRDMWFVLERLAPMPIKALLQAGEDLIVGLQRLSSDLNVSVMQYDAIRPRGISVALA